MSADEKLNALVQAVHRMSNELQCVLGYMEIRDYDKALASAKNLTGEVEKCRKEIVALRRIEKKP